jgi:hypothetical protein
MKLKAAAVMLLLLSCAAARAQGEQVEIDVGHLQIVFTPPKGLPRVGADELRRLSSSGSTMRAAFGDLRQGMLAVETFDAGPKGVTDGDLESLKKKLEADVADTFPAAEWMSREVVTINGPRWLRLRYQVPGLAHVVSDAYAIVWFGKVVTFALYAPAAEYERQRPAFEKSAASLRLILSARPVPDAKPAPRPGRRNP